MTNDSNRKPRQHIRVDADACPVSVRSIVERISQKKGIPVVYYIDDSHELDPRYGEVRQVGRGRDAVDLALINQTQATDLVITQDYGLAALVLAKGALAVHPGGMEYTDHNIDRLLAERHLAAKARKAGERIRHHKKRNHQDNESFEHCFRRLAGTLASK